MSTTALDIFEKAMALMDNLDSSGDADISDNLEYKNRTVPILNILLHECYMASDTFAIVEDVVTECVYPRPIPTEIALISSAVPLDDAVCRNVLPYGLAAHFSLGENTTQASYFQQRYEENLAKIKATVPSVSVDIENVYGEYGISDGVSWG